MNKFTFEPLDGEIWKPIKGFDGYFVSNFGRVWSNKQKKRFVMSRDIEEEVARYERINRTLYMQKEWLRLKAEIDDEYAMKRNE